MVAWEKVVGLVGRVPPAVWAVVMVANVVLTVLTWSVARRRMRWAGQRAADPTLVSGGAKTRDTALTVASMIPAGLFWAMVLTGSFHGLVAFGREVLGWQDGWEYLIPGTLDGVSVTFAFLAFCAPYDSVAPVRGFLLA